MIECIPYFVIAAISFISFIKYLSTEEANRLSDFQATSHVIITLFSLFMGWLTFVYNLLK